MAFNQQRARIDFRQYTREQSRILEDWARYFIRYWNGDLEGEIQIFLEANFDPETGRWVSEDKLYIPQARPGYEPLLPPRLRQLQERAQARDNQAFP